MRRREFIAGLGSAAAWPVVARAQQSAMPVIGYLGNNSPQATAPFLAAFHLGLKEVGYVEGQTATIEYRWAQGQNDRLSVLAAELARHRVAVIVTGGLASAFAAKAATQTIPVVFLMGSNAIETGLVESYNRPGRNFTGVAVFSYKLIAKRLQFLHDVVPGATSIALIVNPTNPGSVFQAREAKAGAGLLGLGLQVLNASVPTELDEAFALIVQQRIGAVLVMDDSFLIGQRSQLVALSSRHALPAIYPHREFTATGGLVSYGPSLTDSNRQVGIYTGRILKGKKPADMPVQQPTKFELVINLKTAKALGLIIPETLLATADEVIQ
jgi:putative tryptophan/tyrosine transport system substrate-binding protein